MQVQGVGSEHNHSRHQVTGCVHADTVVKKGAETAAFGAKDTFENSQQEKPGTEGENTLSWWRTLLASGKKLLLKIWGETPGQNTDSGESEMNITAGKPEVNTIAEKPGDGITGTVEQVMAQNPYFSAVTTDMSKTKPTLGDKIKIRFQSVTDYLTKQFSGKNTAQTKQERPKEDLRKHSRYRQDDLEIDCVLTDDSYLLDSYDRKGEYSKLSPKK